MKVRIYIPIALLLMLSIAGSLNAFTLGSVMLNQQPIGIASNTWAYVLDSANRGWLAYYGITDNRLYVRRPDGTEIGLDDSERERYQSGLAVTSVEQDLAVLWRDKLPAKTLYLLPNVDSDGSLPEPLVAAGEESEPLTRLLLSHQDGVTYLLWLGEKGLDVRSDKESDAAGETGQSQPQDRQPYHLYFRYTEDNGKTFSPVERVLPGYYPTWIISKNAIPVFSWYPVEDQLSVIMRVFDRTQKNFGPLVKIADAPPLSPIYQAFESGGSWFLLWVGQYGENREQVLEGVVSEDRGSTWRRFAFESLRGLDFSRLDTASDGRGHILISVSGSWRFRDEGSNTKDDIYVLRSNDNGATWSEPYQPRPAELRQFQARDPSAVFGTQPGSVLLVWEDWRDIRPNVYAQVSTDHGATWSEAVLLDATAAAGFGQDFRNKTAFTVDDNRYQILAKRYRDLNYRQFDLVRYELTAADLKRLAIERAKQKTDRASEAQLRERVKVYWQAMQEEDWGTTYAMNDPFFRTKVGYRVYESARGLIKYHGYEILEIIREGSIARVRGRFESSVPEFTTRGQIYSQPRQSYEKTENWLFVDGDWYREYHEEAQDIRFTRY